MDEDALVLADLHLRLVFDEEVGERLEFIDDGANRPSLIQCLGMLRLAEDVMLNADVYADEADDE